MPFQIIRNDITRVPADAIVNTANPYPIVGGGTDSAIYHAAGESQLLAERRKIGNIEPGNAVSTPAFKLNAKYIIHTVGPSWIDGRHGEREILHACYANSLALAGELGCKSIAFPMIATGIYGFPKDEALDIALNEIGKYLLTHEMEVILVVFDSKAFELSSKIVGDIEEYIDENSVGLIIGKEYGDSISDRRRRLRDQEELFKLTEMSPQVNYPRAPQMDDMFELCMESAAYAAEEEDKNLADLLGKKEETFQEKLFELIDERGLKDSDVYKKANIDRKVFSKIRCNADYKPKKKTAVAFAIALELDMPAMEDLLARAEIALSPSSKFDLIISYFVKNKNYDIYTINSALFKYDQPLLGY